MSEKPLTSGQGEAPVAESPAPVETEKPETLSAEKAELIKEKTQLRGAMVLSALSKEDETNILREAVELKTSQSKLARIPIIGTVIKPMLMSHYFVKSARAMRDSGDVTKAYTELGLDSATSTAFNTESAEYAELRARLALAENAFPDKIDASDSLILNQGESVNRIEDETSNKVKSALADYFENLKNAGGDEEAKKAAKATFDEAIQSLSKDGLLGQGPTKKRNAFLESGLVKYLIGDHSSPNTTNLQAIQGAAKSVEALVSEDVSKSELTEYLDKNVSFYSASMKEGVYTKQRVNNVMGAIVKAGAIGGLTYALIGREARGTVNQAANSVLSSTLGAFGAGAAAGGVLGAIRGAGQARVNMSKAEIKAATSAEAILTPEEAAEAARKAAEEATASSKEDEQPTGEDEETGDGEKLDEATEEKTKNLFALLEKFNGAKRKLTGEEAYAAKVEEALGRKSAKDIYDEMSKLIEEIESGDLKGKKLGVRKSALRKLLTDFIARNTVSQAEGVDLISYSKGNVSKERYLLSTKVSKARELTGYDIKKHQGRIDDAAAKYSEKIKSANKEKRKYIARQALVDGVIGAAVGGSIGAIASAVREASLSGAAAGTAEADDLTGEAGDNNGSIFEPVNGGELGQEGEIITGNPEDIDLNPDFAEGAHSFNLEIKGEEIADIEFNPDGSLTEETLRELEAKGIEVNTEIIERAIPGATKEVSLEEFFSPENAEENGLFEITGRSWNTNDGDARAIIGNIHMGDEGSIIVQVAERPGEDLNLDEMKMIFTPGNGVENIGITVDVQPDGSVIIPADSPVADLFDGSEYQGGFAELIREGEDGRIEVFATIGDGRPDIDTLTIANPSAVENIYNYTITVDGTTYELDVPPSVYMATHLENATGMEAIKGLDEPIGYEAVAGSAVTELRTNSGELVQVEQVEHYGGYSEAADSYFSELKDSANNSGVSVVREMVGAEGAGLSSREIDQIFLEKIESGEITEGDVIETYLETMGKSPEALVTTRAMMGGFEMDLNGDGVLDLIDTQDEINIAADILSSSDGYSEFVNDTFDEFYDKIEGGSIEFIDYAEEQYQYSTWGVLDEKNHNVLQRLGRINGPTHGVGIVFKDAAGNSIYDEATVRKLWRLPENYDLDYIADRLNCIQKTGRGIFLKTDPENTKVEPEKTEPEKTESEKTEPEKTEVEKTESEKTESEKTEPEKTESEKTEPEKTEDEKTGSEKTEPEKTEPEKTSPEKTGSEKTEPEITPKGPDANAGDETDLPLTPEQGDDFVQPTEDNHVNPNVAPGTQVTTPPTDDSAFNQMDADTATGDDTTSQYDTDTSGWQGEPEPAPENRPTEANPGSAEENIPNRSDEELANLVDF